MRLLRGLAFFLCASWMGGIASAELAIRITRAWLDGREGRVPIESCYVTKAGKDGHRELCVTDVPVEAGDRINTGDGASIELYVAESGLATVTGRSAETTVVSHFAQKGRILMLENTEFELLPEGVLAKLGRLRFQLESAFDIETTYLTLGPRGTAFELGIEGAKVRVVLVEGAIDLADKQDGSRRLSVSAGLELVMPDGLLSEASVRVAPDGVREAIDLWLQTESTPPLARDSATDPPSPEVPIRQISHGLAARPALGAWAGGAELLVNRNIPPILALSDKTVAVEVRSVGAAPRPIADKLATRLRRTVRSRLANGYSEASPDVVLTAVVTSFDIARMPSGPRAEASEQVRGELVVSFAAREESTGAPLDSDILYAICDNGPGRAGLGRNLTPWFKIRSVGAEPESPGAECNGDAALTDEELTEAMIQQIVSQLVERTSTREEAVSFIMPGGKFKRFRPLAAQGRWLELIEELKEMGPMSDTKDDADRRYFMALAYEALAYVSTDPDSTRELLARAKASYTGAREIRPSRTQFILAEDRLKGALQTYSQIIFNRLRYTEYSPDSGLASVAASRGRDVLDNAAIVEMYDAQVDERLILRLIRTGPDPQFSVDPMATIGLAQSGVSPVVIEAMRARMEEVRKNRPAPRR